MSAIQDPKEYLPFLRSLRALDMHTQRFAIDDYLGRQSKAVLHLARSSTDPFDQVLQYTKKHALFSTVLEAYTGDVARSQVIRNPSGFGAPS